jgi:hypothetical protein
MARSNYRLTKLRDGTSRLSSMQGTGDSAVPDGPYRSTEYGSGLLKDVDQEPIQFRVFSNTGSLIDYFPWFCAETINFSLSSKIQQFITQDGEKLVNNGPAISTLEITGYIPLISIDTTPITVEISKNSRGGLKDSSDQYAVPKKVNPNLPQVFSSFYETARLSALAYSKGYAEVTVDGIRCTGGFVSRTSEERADRPNVVVCVLSFVCTDISTPYRYNPLNKSFDKVSPPTEAEKNPKASK